MLGLQKLDWDEDLLKVCDRLRRSDLKPESQFYSVTQNLVSS